MLHCYDLVTHPILRLQVIFSTFHVRINLFSWRGFSRFCASERVLNLMPDPASASASRVVTRWHKDGIDTINVVLRCWWKMKDGRMWWRRQWRRTWLPLVSTRHIFSGSFGGSSFFPSAGKQSKSLLARFEKWPSSLITFNEMLRTIIFIIGWPWLMLANRDFYNPRPLDGAAAVVSVLLQLGC